MIDLDMKTYKLKEERDTLRTQLKELKANPPEDEYKFRAEQIYLLSHELRVTDELIALHKQQIVQAKKALLAALCD